MKISQKLKGKKILLLKFLQLVSLFSTGQILPLGTLMKDSHHCIVDAINWNPFENAT